MSIENILGPVLTKTYVSKIRKQAREDAKEGNYKADDYDKTSRVIYARAYLSAREKMRLLGVAGEGK